MKKRLKSIAQFTLVLLMGVLIGGYLFSDTCPRSVLALTNCGGTCLQPNELVGLLTSVGIQRAPSVLPSVVKETDKTIVIQHPSPHGRTHYLIIPKTDIKNISEVSSTDSAYLIDAFQVIRALVKEKGMADYQVVTNGPGNQGVTYLHFHLIER
jgi:Scavenger mRNA decapping enzyme C-term binding